MNTIDTRCPAWCEVLIATTYLSDEKGLNAITNRFSPNIRKNAVEVQQSLLGLSRASAIDQCRSVLDSAGLSGLGARLAGSVTAAVTNVERRYAGTK